MTSIRVRELSTSDHDQFQVWVDFGDSGGGEAQVTNPASAEGERLLAWYFEHHLRFPFLDKDREQEAEDLVTSCGRSLFSQVFSGEAAFGYRRFKDRGFDGCRLVIEGSAAFHRLHWETLCDPSDGSRLALRMPLVRRVDRLPLAFELPQEQPIVRILVVTARPDGPKDVGYRMISRPLMEALRTAHVPVEVDIVRPGTWQALKDRLRHASHEHGTGWYQVVHFDVHGAFGDPRTIAANWNTGNYVLDPAASAPDGTPAEQGFLFFETDTIGRAQPVSAGTIAKLLADHRIAVIVLNSCQSAMQTAGSEASLAHHLVAAGAPVAIGMAYSVTVSAAAVAMPAFYSRLAAGAEPSTAILAMRQALDDHKVRRVHFDQDLDLEDWVLPVAYIQRPFALRMRPMDQAERERFYARQAQTAVEPAVENGFLGRDLDLHMVERQLLLRPDRNHLLLQGMVGSGKSTLLAHAGWWWQRTGLVGQVFRFSFEERAWRKEQVVRDIASNLLNAQEFAAWETLSEHAQAGQVAAMLSATRHLLIIDNVESITAATGAIPHTLTEPERRSLAAFLASLRGGRSIVLIGSREPESWLAASTFADNVYALSGLDSQATSVLAERILVRHGATRYLADAAQRAALEDLITLLDGYPLPMEVALPALATTTPVQLLSELQAGSHTADPLGLIRAAIDYSYGKLSDRLQYSLLFLAPFVGCVNAGSLDVYRNLLNRREDVPDLESVDLHGAIAQARRLGLATQHPELKETVRLQPVLPYYLRNRIAAQPDLTKAVDHVHYLLTNVISGAMYDLLQSSSVKDRRLAQAVVRAEYANITAALDYALLRGEPLGRLITVLDEFLTQTYQHPTRRAVIHNALDVLTANSEPSESTQADLAIVHQIAGQFALSQGRLDDAAAHEHTAFQLRQASEANRHNEGVAHLQLGKIAARQRSFQEAEAQTSQAFAIFNELEDHKAIAAVHHQRGEIAREQRQFDVAEQHYRAALDVFQQLDDPVDTAATFTQLGRIASEQRRFGDAAGLYQRALEIEVKFGDWASAAGSYLNLGITAQSQGRLTDADAYYRQALEAYLRANHQQGAARTLHQLGRIAQEQQRYAEADRYFQNALQAFQELDDRHGTASALHQLGLVAQLREKLVDAEAFYKHALQVKEELGDRHNLAVTIYQRGRLAAQQRLFSDARTHFLDALETYTELGDNRRAAQIHVQLGICASGEEHLDEAETHYLAAIELWLQQGDLAGAAAAYHELGIFMQQQNRNVDGLQALLLAAAAHHRATGHWPHETLLAITQHREAIDGQTYSMQVEAIVPNDLVPALTRAICELGAAIDSNDNDNDRPETDGSAESGR